MDLLRVSWFPIILISKDVKHDNGGREGGRLKIALGITST
jgi:hypothetical protein